jgi:hypothetical protein
MPSTPASGSNGTTQLHPAVNSAKNLTSIVILRHEVINCRLRKAGLPAAFCSRSFVSSEPAAAKCSNKSPTWRWWMGPFAADRA